ncbi:sensor histidine kinase [Algoriella sp.]|uniref:sensor histidine kinase n=1 Tax=Algoriella sp. TaxID=1872434 RepID=UPI00257EFA0A|nr:sensor histidine kinase [Algoriella sp.]
MLIVNSFVFYLFFYGLVPLLMKGNRTKTILLLLISFPVGLYIWLTITYFISFIYHYFGFEIPNGELKGAIGMSMQQTFWEAISVKRILSQAFIVISILSPFFFVKILFEVSRNYSKMLSLTKQKTTLEIENINIEKDFLKAQLNPHFLFNTLNNLYGLVLKKDQSASEVILNLSDLMSYTLYESNTDKVLIEKEVDFISNYFQLEKMRYNSTKQIELFIQKTENLNHVFIAPLLTFTFIENAFKYGLKSNYPFLNLKLTITPDLFDFFIENDVEENRSEDEFGGIGILNIQKRLTLLYPNQHQLLIENSENKYTIHLKINLKNES